MKNISSVWLGNLQHKSRSNTQHWLVSFCHHMYKTQLSSLQEHKTVELEEHELKNKPYIQNQTFKYYNCDNSTCNTCMLAYKICIKWNSVTCQHNETSLPSASCWACNRSDKTWPGWAGQSPHRSCSNIEIKEVNDKGQVQSIETICMFERLYYV